MQERSNQPKNAGLIARNIFGHTVPLHKPDRKPTALRRRLTAKKVRPVRTIFAGSTDDSTEIRCIWPFITAEAFAATLDRYRDYIARHNERIKQFNSQIEVFNMTVDKAPKDEVLTAFATAFMVKHFRTKPTIFNHLADEFNNERGLAIKKKKLPTVKYTSEKVFQEMLYSYSQQLAARSAERIRIGTDLATEVPPFNIASSRLTAHRRGEAKSIDVCNATIRNHRERLEEAGVLIDYTFRGHKKGVQMRINPEILVVIDGKTQQIATAENQRVKAETCKKFSNIDEATRAFNNSIKKRENAGGDSPEKGTPQAADDLSLFYKSISTQSNSDTPGRAPNVKVSRRFPISDELESLIEHPQALSVDLASGTYHNYTPIDIRKLRSEAYYGTLSREQFNELVIQDCMKTAARLYRGSTPFPGSWKIAYQTWIEKRFWVSNGNGRFLCSKDMMVDFVQQFRWRLADAEKWFRKTEIKPLYPSLYFDFTRTEKKEIGFEYTRHRWLKHLKYLEQKPRKEKAVKKAAEARKVQINYSKRYENQINRFFRNRITFDELFDYVSSNLPKQYLEKLHQTVLNVAAGKNYSAISIEDEKGNRKI